MRNVDVLKQEKDKIIDLYLNKKLSLSNIGKIYGCHYLKVKELLVENNIQLRTHSEDVSLKVERYTKTCLRKYGFKNVSQINIIKDKKEQTCFKHYGVKNPMKTEECQKKSRETCLRKYGVDNPSKAESIKQKKIQRVKDIDPNCTNYYQLKEIKEKLKNKFILKYGVDNPMKSEEIRQKAYATNIKRYGTSVSILNKEIREKSKKTCLKRYGTEFYVESSDFHHKCLKKYFYDNQYFDSLPELSLYIYAKDNNIDIVRLPLRLDYVFNDNTYHYYPDFKFDGRLIEIKNDYLYKKMLIENTRDNAKLKCMIDNNVDLWLPTVYNKYIKYCVDKYGRDFKKLFKNVIKGGDAHV